MKYALRIFIDDYETVVSNLKENELKAITTSIIEYINNQKFSFTIEMKRYYDPVALNVPSSFKEYDGKRIHLEPFGFHQKLDIQFDYINDWDSNHYCHDIWCEGDCGVLSCGVCIDMCRCHYDY